ncbi:MAG: hypothetical protein AAGA66_14840 [Bacteroidota bacterium]
MRNCGIVIVLLLGACKASAPTGSSAYFEDLSVHRPVLSETKKADTLPSIRMESFSPMYGHIKSEMDSIINVSIAQNKKGKLVDGYTLLVYTGNDRDEANDVRYRVSNSFPNLNPKGSYRQPNFQVRAGRFTDRLKAHQALNSVKKEFPKALLVPERFKISYE